MKNGPYELVVAPSNYPGKLYRNRYAYEHHVVYWQHTGKVVPKGFLLHHKDEDKRNNVFSNLELQRKTEHGKHHALYLEHPTTKCIECGEMVTLTRHQMQGKAGPFCSRVCTGRYGARVRYSGAIEKPNKVKRNYSRK